MLVHAQPWQVVKADFTDTPRKIVSFMQSYKAERSLKRAIKPHSINQWLRGLSIFNQIKGPIHIFTLTYISILWLSSGTIDLEENPLLLYMIYMMLTLYQMARPFYKTDCGIPSCSVECSLPVSLWIRIYLCVVTPDMHKCTSIYILLCLSRQIFNLPTAHRGWISWLDFGCIIIEIIKFETSKLAE